MRSTWPLSTAGNPCIQWYTGRATLPMHRLVAGGVIGRVAPPGLLIAIFELGGAKNAL